MKIKNVNFVSVAEVFIADHKAGIQSYLTSQPAELEFITFDKIRADFPALADQLTDGMLSAIFQELGIDVLT